MKAFIQQWHILKALIIRDMILRYGRENIGFFWVILEPMILCAGVTALWSLAKQPYEHGIHIITFVITGYMPLTLLRHITNPNVHILRRNLSLFVHRKISFIDIIVSRAILEFIGTTIALCFIYAFLYSMHWAEPIDNWELVLSGWLLLAWFSFGVGLCLAFATEISESAAHFVGPVQYLSIPLSPTFYMVNWLPQNVQELLYFNPLSHPYEMMRAGVFGPGVNAVYSPLCTFIYGLFCVAFGLWGLDNVREKLYDQ